MAWNILAMPLHQIASCSVAMEYPRFIGPCLVCILLLLFFINTGAFSQQTCGNVTIDQFLTASEDNIDLGDACLTLAKEVYPELKVEAFSRILDYMADRILLLNKGNMDPVARIGLLNTYFFRPGWWNDSIFFTYDLDDLDAARKNNRYLNGILASKKGSCITISMLYLAVADRLHWPIVPVRAAKHIFCRYLADGFDENNIEPTCGGGYLTNEQYIEQGGIPEKGIRNGVYLRPLTKKEYLATLLSNHAIELLGIGKSEKARQYLELSISLDSTLSTAYWNLGEWHYQKARMLDSAWTDAGSREKGSSPALAPETQIQYHLSCWKSLKARAKELGIVLRFPESFYAGQAKAIEQFKKTGEY
jgi:regulator of sirC expression with transglutaminase-like and TPR domain